MNHLMDYSEEIKKLQNESPFAWWEWDVAENKVDFNDLKASMIGYDPISLRLKGYQAFTDLLHPDDFEKTMDAMRVVLQGETNLYHIDYRIKAKTGIYHWYMDRGIVMKRDSSNVPLIIRGIVIDLGHESAPSGRADIIVELLNLAFSSNKQQNKPTFTICANCSRIKYFNENWIIVKPDLLNLMNVNHSHTICNDCLISLYPDMAEKIISLTTKPKK